LQAIEAMEVSGLEAAHSSAAAASGGAAAAAEAKEEVPSDLLCPITYQLLEDPVILVDSHQTYGKDLLLCVAGLLWCSRILRHCLVGSQDVPLCQDEVCCVARVTSNI
jgi:hypothetical protein